MTTATITATTTKYRPSKGDARYGRSKLTNHRDLSPKIADGRAGAARRFRDLVRALIADMGGLENCSEVKLVDRI
jgi:hypothetical protein